jgi:hypothetical protein
MPILPLIVIFVLQKWVDDALMDGRPRFSTLSQIVSEPLEQAREVKRRRLTLECSPPAQKD